MLAAEPGDPIGDAIAHVERAFEPVPTDPTGRAGWKAAMDERLRRLAVKIAPGMSVDQGSEWRNVMADALADLPAMIALTAAKRAIHKPMKFLNEVEGVVREIAAEVIAERRLARSRLDHLRLSPAPAPALPPQAEGAPFSADEIRKMSSTMRELGIRTGAITQEQVDEVEASEPKQVLRDERRATATTPTTTEPAIRPEPTAADYLALGLTEEEAEQALAERRRMLARGNRQSFAHAASATLKSHAA